VTSIDEWVDSIEPRLARLEELYLPDGFVMDFSGDSLVALEAVLLQRFHDGHDLLTADSQLFIESAASYIGETLLRIAGGSWQWHDGRAIVQPDPETGLDPVAPALLVVGSVRDGTGNVLRTVHSAFERAVAARVAEDPTWSPTKEWTPGVDSRVVPVASEFLANWLAERAAAFPGWMTGHGNGEKWDFSPESLDTLETVTRAQVGTIDGFAKPAHQDFVDGACWYFGEVVRRVHGAFWNYNGGEPDPEDPWVGYPYVWRDKNPPHGSVPFYVLQVALVERGFLRVELARFA
jgi:hypothetical protein